MGALSCRVSSGLIRARMSRTISSMQSYETFSSSLNKFSKKLLTSVLIAACPMMRVLSPLLSSLIVFHLCLSLHWFWKNFVFWLPSLSQRTHDLSLQSCSSCLRIDWRLFSSSISLRRCSLVISVSSIFDWWASILLTMSSLFLVGSWKWSFTQYLRACLNLLIFFSQEKAGDPGMKQRQA